MASDEERRDFLLPVVCNVLVPENQKGPVLGVKFQVRETARIYFYRLSISYDF